MKKRVRKENRISWTEVGALIEAMRSESKPYLEVIPGIQERLNATYEQVGKNTESIELLRLLVTKNSEETKRIREIVTKTAEEVESIREELKSKADRKDFELLEKKVASIAG